MTIRVKKLFPDVRVPLYAHPGDAGLDVFSREQVMMKPGDRHVFHLGFSAELPRGSVALVWDKSGFGVKGVKVMGGVIDASFRGEWAVTLQNLTKKGFRVQKGDKIAQVLIQRVERVNVKVVKKLGSTRRGGGRFGSTGR